MLFRLKAVLKNTFVYTVYKYQKEKRKAFTKFVGRVINEKIRYPWIYNRAKRLPVDEAKVVFIEVRLSNVSNSIQLIYNEIVKNYEFDIHVHFLRTGFVSPKETYKRSVDMLRDVATAKYVFINDGVPMLSAVNLRKETILTQTWHGCGAFKRFGYSTADYIFGASGRDMKVFPFHRNYTHVTISSDEVKWAYAEAMNIPEEADVIKATGVSRTDIFYDQEFIKAAYQKLYRLMPSAAEKKVILYSPTFRGRAGSAKTPNMLNVSMFAENLEEDYVLIYKHHPLVKKRPGIPERVRDFASDMTETMTIEELLCVSDICISDYSSLIYEYSIFERPMLFYAFDIAEFDDWRGFYYDFKEMVPGPIFKTNREMIHYIKNIDRLFNKQLVIDFKELFMKSCDGKATERIIQTVFGDALKIRKREKPLEGEFYRVPDCNEGMHRVRLSKYQKMYAYKKWTNEIYEKALAQENNKVKDGVVLLTDGSSNYDSFTNIMNDVYNLNANKYVLNRERKDYRKETAKAIQAISRAKIICVDSDLDIINMLPISEETQVLYLPNNSMVIEKFGYSSIEYISGYNKKYLAITPRYSNIDTVAIASEMNKFPFIQSLKDGADLQFANVGIPRTDYYFSKDYIKELKTRLKEAHPEINNRKIILYAPIYRKQSDNINKPVTVEFRWLHEYLYYDYVILMYYIGNCDQKPKTAKFYEDFVYDVSEEFNVQDLMVMADVVIGDYDPLVFEAAIVNKPLFLYAPDYINYFEKKDSFVQYETLLPEALIDNPKELASQIADVADYNYQDLMELKQKYFTFCDGYATQKLVDFINKQ